MYRLLSAHSSRMDANFLNGAPEIPFMVINFLLKICLQNPDKINATKYMLLNVGNFYSRR